MGLGIAVAVNGVPDTDLIQASTVEVNERMGEATTFSLRYPVSISEGDIPILKDSRLDVGSVLSVLVPVGAKTHCIVKGPVHSQQVHLEHGGGSSWLEVKGSDSMVKMDRESKSVVWADVTDSAAATSIFANYQLVPDVQLTMAGHFETKHTLVQRDSDLRFVRRLARRNGFLFWVTSDEFGVETAHFKRPPLDGSAEADLVINLDSPSVLALDINWDVERPTSIEGVQLDLNAKSNLDVAVARSPQTPLGSSGLKDITGDTRSVFLSAPADDTGDMTARGEGALIEADWFIKANCETNLTRLGTVARAHTVVEVKGAGSRHSGKYFVAGVRHSIDASDHKMSLELVRNGWGT